MTREEQIQKESVSFCNKVCPQLLVGEYYFIQGAEWADNHPKSPWISVEDDLPCNHEELLNAKYQTKEVFVLRPGSFPDIDYMLKIDGKWTWFEYKTSKFWMPIPELPKE